MRLLAHHGNFPEESQTGVFTTDATSGPPQEILPYSESMLTPARGKEAGIVLQDTGLTKAKPMRFERLLRQPIQVAGEDRQNERRGCSFSSLALQELCLTPWLQHPQPRQREPPPAGTSQCSSRVWVHTLNQFNFKHLI